MKRFSGFAIILLLFTVNGFAQTKKDTLNIERALSYYSIKGFSFSPDGSKAVAVVSQTGVADNLPASHIWMIDIAARTLRQFTYLKNLRTRLNGRPTGRNWRLYQAVMANRKYI